MPVIKLIVDGGSMSPGPAVAQQLGPMGINIGKVIESVNSQTSGFKGMKVPVILDVDPKTKEFTVEVSSPPMSELIKKELKLEKASGLAGKTYAGNIAIEQLISVAKTKMPDLLARDMKAAVKLAVGSCVSLGILVESKPAKEIEIEITSGTYDSEISAEKTDVPPEKKASLDEYFTGIKSEQDAAAKAAEAEKAAEEAKKLEDATAKPEEGKEEGKEEASDKKPEAKKK